jgi:hypothetical protein
MFNGWPNAIQLQACTGTTTVSAPNDVAVCNGQLREAVNDDPAGTFDGGGVSALTMYPRQPFDFTGRTGTVSFDISNDSHGTHAAWPEFWFSNLPVPAPFIHSSAIGPMLPQHGFGIRFAASADPGQQNLCQNQNNFSVRRWTVDTAAVVRNYVMDDTINSSVIPAGPNNARSAMVVQQLDCVIAPPDNSGITNHVELRISQNQIDVYAADAGNPASLRKIATVSNANLSATTGLIWLEDVHYNADKGDPSFPSQRQHTFVWDNVAFDGPFTHRDFGFDALDNNQPGGEVNTVNLGKWSNANQTSTWSVAGVPANPQAAAALVFFDYNYDQSQPKPTTINVIVNGHAHSGTVPYQPLIWGQTYTTGIPIALSDLVAGTNTVQIGADQGLSSFNINIVLANVPGGVPVLPGSNNAYPAGVSH